MSGVEDRFVIEVRGLTKAYGPIVAIRDVSFEVEEGEIIGFLGPNAAGKTTTMRILTGFSPPSRGVARIAGFDVRRDPIEVKRRVGYLPESVPLYPEMLVAKFLHYVAAVRGIPRRERSREVDCVIERCGLESMRRRVIRNLSKGYRQRVGLAQALVGNPPVLILDEPTVGLDPKQIIEIRDMIRSLAKEHTVLLSTHILPEVTMVCERVIIIHRGRIVAQDSVSRLAQEAENEVQIEVLAGGTPDEVLRVLRAVPDVVGVSAQGAEAYIVKASAGRPVAERAASALVGAGLAVRGIQEKARSLEEVFMEVVTSDDERGPS